MEWFWLALTIGLIVIECTTVDLVCIWFACGAGITSLLSALITNLPLYGQIIIFVLVSAGLLIATRPLARKLLKKQKDSQKTNLDLVIGKKAIVVEDIDNIQGKGAVKINGLVWSARSENGENISKDTIVRFKQINGNKAVVVKED